MNMMTFDELNRAVWEAEIKPHPYWGRPFSQKVFNFILKHFNHKLDAIIVVSHHAKGEVVKHYGADPDKVHVIYNGGGEDFKPLRLLEQNI